MRVALLTLLYLLSSCGASESPPRETAPANPTPAPAPQTVAIHETFADGVRLRGIVQRARRTRSRWGGEVTLLRLDRANDLRVLVAGNDLEPGQRVTLQGALRALDLREGTFHESEGDTEETSPLPVVMRLDDARLVDADRPHVETLAELLDALAPIRVDGTLLGHGADGSLRVRIADGTPVCVRTQVVAEAVERFEALEGRHVSLQGSLRPDLRPPPEPTEACWTLRGVSLTQPTVLTDDGAAP